MINNHKLIFAIGLLAIASVLYSGFYIWSAKQTAPINNPVNNSITTAGQEEQSQPQLQTLPAASGNINNFARAIDADINNQTSLLQSQESEADEIMSDSSAIEGFGQIYNENDY
jgi:hypothetical protein